MGVAAVKVGSGPCGAWDVGNSASYRLAEFQFLLILFMVKTLLRRVASDTSPIPLKSEAYFLYLCLALPV